MSHDRRKTYMFYKSMYSSQWAAIENSTKRLWEVHLGTDSYKRCERFFSYRKWPTHLFFSCALLTSVKPDKIENAYTDFKLQQITLIGLGRVLTLIYSLSDIEFKRFSACFLFRLNLGRMYIYARILHGFRKRTTEVNNHIWMAAVRLWARQITSSGAREFFFWCALP